MENVALIIYLLGVVHANHSLLMFNEFHKREIDVPVHVTIILIWPVVAVFILFRTVYQIITE